MKNKQKIKKHISHTTWINMLPWEQPVHTCIDARHIGGGIIEKE